MKNKYAADDHVKLPAVPSAGYVFDSWSGQTNSGTGYQGITDVHQNPVTFQIGDDTDNNREITANFIPSDLHCTLKAMVEPGSGGSVGLQPAQPAEGYAANESVRVFATAESGYVFSHWGDVAGSENPRTILVSEDKVFTAIFNPTVTIYCSPSEAGSVSPEPAQSSNGYTAGTDVTLTADPAKGYRFVAWEGDLSGSAKSVTVTVDEAKTIGAKFAKLTTSRWWLWVIIVLVGLLGVLLLSRLVYARMNRGASDDTQSPHG